MNIDDNNISYIEKLEIVCKLDGKDFSGKIISQMLNCTRQNVYKKINKRNFRESDMKLYADLFGYNFILEIEDISSNMKTKTINEMREAKGITIEALGKMDGINFTSAFKKLKRESGMTEESISLYCKLMNCRRHFIFLNKITGERI